MSQQPSQQEQGQQQQQRQYRYTLTYPASSTTYQPKQQEYADGSN
ncbi:6386_t:CDS:1, partial [Paraglomus brasilianum]